MKQTLVYNPHRTLDAATPIRFTTLSCKRHLYHARSRSSEEPWRSHSTAICSGWVAKHNSTAPAMNPALQPNSSDGFKFKAKGNTRETMGRPHLHIWEVTGRQGGWEIVGGSHLGDNWKLSETSGRQLGEHIWNKLGNHWEATGRRASVKQPETTETTSGETAGKRDKWKTLGKQLEDHIWETAGNLENGRPLGIWEQDEISAEQWETNGRVGNKGDNGATTSGRKHLGDKLKTIGEQEPRRQCGPNKSRRE